MYNVMRNNTYIISLGIIHTIIYNVIRYNNTYHNIYNVIRYIVDTPLLQHSLSNNTCI